MNSVDRYGYHLINQWAGHSPVLDQFMSFTAQYGLELYVLLFVVAWFSLPKPEVDRRHALIVAGLSGILALLINVLISNVWLRPRPFVSLPKGSFTQLIPHSIDASFPSDHVSGSFAFAAGSWKNAERWVSYSFTIFSYSCSHSACLHWRSLANRRACRSHRWNIEYPNHVGSESSFETHHPNRIAFISLWAIRLKPSQTR